MKMGMWMYFLPSLNSSKCMNSIFYEVHGKIDFGVADRQVNAKELLMIKEWLFFS
jgi:hypothetical protein